MRKSNLSFWAGIVLLIGFVALVALPYVADLKDPAEQKTAVMVDGKLMMAPLPPGTPEYILGSDRAGRDLLSRLAFGARITLGIGLGVTLCRLLVAVPLGLLGGWYGGWLKRCVQGSAYLLGPIPVLLTVTLILSSTQVLLPEDWYIPVFVLVVAVAGIPRLAQYVQSLTEEFANRDHIEAAVAVGATPARILRKHVLPLMRGDLLISFASEMAWVISLMGQLAFFGIFVGGSVDIRYDHGVVIVEKLPDWGQMLSGGRPQIQTHPWIAGLPALALGLSAACFHLLAEGARQRWARR